MVPRVAVRPGAETSSKSLVQFVKHKGGINRCAERFRAHRPITCSEREGSGVETFKALRNREKRQLGEYRTQRLVLEAWDRFERDGTFGQQAVKMN